MVEAPVTEGFLLSRHIHCYLFCLRVSSPGSDGPGRCRPRLLVRNTSFVARPTALLCRGTHHPHQHSPIHDRVASACGRGQQRYRISTRPRGSSATFSPCSDEPSRSAQCPAAHDAAGWCAPPGRTEDDPHDRDRALDARPRRLHAVERPRRSARAPVMILPAPRPRGGRRLEPQNPLHGGGVRQATELQAQRAQVPARAGQGRKA